MYYRYLCLKNWKISWAFKCHECCSPHLKIVLNTDDNKNVFNNIIQHNIFFHFLKTFEWIESNVMTQIKTIYGIYFVMSSSLHWFWHIQWLNTSVCINKCTGLFCRALVCSMYPRPVRIWLCSVSHLWPLGGWAEWWNIWHRSKAEYATFLRKKVAINKLLNYTVIMSGWLLEKLIF